MAQINEHVNYSFKKKLSHDQMRIIVVSLVSKKWKNNNNSTCQLNRLQNSILMSIVDIHETDLSDIDWKSGTRKVRTSSVKSSSILFSCSIHAMYIRVKFTKKKHFMLNSYLPGIIKSNFPKIHYGNVYYENLVYEWHDWKQNHPCVIHSTNVSYSLLLKLMKIL